MPLTMNPTGETTKDEWSTPKFLYNFLDEQYHFDFDPCPINPTFDGLAVDWKERNFVNPPYSDNYRWVKKCYEEYQKGKLVVLLIYARTDTRYFHEFCLGANEIVFIKGRLKFGNAKNPATAPSMIVIFDGRIPNNKRNLLEPVISGLDARELEKIMAKTITVPI